MIDAGLVWVGPPPQAIRTLGNKSSARQIAQARGVPCLPGYQGEDQSDERFAAEAQRIGFPVMVKAAAGGGGRGMRLVTQPAQLLAAVHSARSEAQSAFGSGELLLERALLAASAMSKCRYSPMRTAIASTWASAIARCSAGTRR